MSFNKLVLFLSLVLITGSVAAQPASQPAPQPAPGPGNGNDPIAGNLFPPELIMQNRAELGLSKDQSKAIIGTIQEFQSGIVETQWQMAEAKGVLTGLLKESPVKKKSVSKALDQLFKLENEVKRSHILMLVELKNELTADQVALLAERRQWAGGRIGDRKQAQQRRDAPARLKQ